MAKNIIITVNARTNAVRVNTETVGAVGENLQGDFIVEFVGDNFISGSGWLEIESRGEKGYIELTQTGKTYTAPIKSGITKYGGRIDAQVRITQAEVDGEIPVFKSDIFHLNTLESINSLEEIPDEYPEWVDRVNAKLEEIKDMELDALPDVTKDDAGKILEVNADGEWVISETLNDIKNTLADLTYKAISVYFSNNVGTVEIGTTVTMVTLSWSFNKTPTSVKLDGVPKAVTSTGETLYNQSITSYKSWTLTATDEKNSVPKTTSISFVNGVYYGVAGAQTAYNSAFILGLNKTLSSTKVSSFTVTAGAEQYIYYCLPTRYGDCSFFIGGYNGGLQRVATIDFENASGYTEEYAIYKSDFANLGKCDITVS